MMKMDCYEIDAFVADIYDISCHEFDLVQNKAIIRHAPKNKKEKKVRNSFE